MKGAPSIDLLAAEVAAILTNRLQAKDVLKLLEIVFLDYDEVAALLRVKKKTVEEWVSRNKIPYRKANGRVLFLLSELLAWTLPEGDTHGPYRLSVAAGSKLAAIHVAASRERKQ